MASNVAAKNNEWTRATVSDKMYKGTITSTSKPDQDAGDFKMSTGGYHADGETLNLWVELKFPRA